MAADETVSIEIACSSCGAALQPSDLFCESCGATVDGEAEATGVLSVDGDDTDPLATRLTAAPSAPPAACTFCGGDIDGDGFCSSCGARGRTWRDHWTESPSEWVGGVCDIGVRHVGNEDAMVLISDPAASSQAVLVVCDGVTTAPHSDRASLAAASEAARHIGEVIHSLSPSASPAAAAAALTDAIVAGCRIAQVAVLGVTRELREDLTADASPSCTFAVAIVHHGLLAAGWCGDSRVYWLPDVGDAMQVSVDHSMATELVAHGSSRAEAEADPLAHTITRWLGADSHDPFADTASVAIDSPGWVLVCSDGLWNYVTEADDLRGMANAAVSNGAVGPVAVAESMAGVANELGGHDNVTVALARVGPVVTQASEQHP